MTGAHHVQAENGHFNAGAQKTPVFYAGVAGYSTLTS